LHIPDGYLSPQTYAPLLGASLTAWAVGLRKIKRELSAKQVPYLSMAAAFSFLIMMFNVPIPGGTTGHAVGGAMIAILLGPWTAVIAVSVVLIIQALVFGDGGVTAIGANCFNMAVAMPFVSWWVFRAVSGGAREGFRLHAASFLAGYIGLLAAAVLTGIEFGIQPIIAQAPDGSPLYSPYPLSIALPAVVLGHMGAFCIVEGLVTMLLVRYFMKSGEWAVDSNAASGFRRKLWIGLAVLAALTPLGIILPGIFGAGGAWGEWSREALKDMLGYLPRGLEGLGGIWKAPIREYGAGGGSPYITYIASGILGIALVALIAYIIRKTVFRAHGEESTTQAYQPEVPVVETAAQAAPITKSRVPQFLLEKHVARADVASGGRLGRSFIDRGMGHLASVIKTAFVQWETATGRGLFQGLDARVKILFLLFFLVVVSVKKDMTSLLAVAGFVSLLAAASRLGLASYYRRVLFLGFFFGFMIALPSALNIIRPGLVVFPIISLSGPHELWIYHIPKDIGVTMEGVRGVGMLTLRVVDSVSLSLLVLYTTPFPEIIRALKVFKVPDAFIVIVNLSYKYIFIFARTVEDMHLAKKSRTVGAVDDSDARKWIAGRIALIFRRTQIRCEELYKAMLSRGFSGDVRLRGFGKAAGRDYAAGFSLLGVGILFLFM